MRWRSTIAASPITTSANTTAPATDLNTAIKINPNYAGAARDRGISNTDKREYDIAVAEADTAIKVTPNYAIAANNRASVYENRRDDDRVIQEVNQTIKSNAAPAVAYYNRANVFYGTRDYDQAIKYYNQAIKLQPDNADALEPALRRARHRRRAEGGAGGLQRGARASSRTTPPRSTIAAWPISSSASPIRRWSTTTRR